MLGGLHRHRVCRGKLCTQEILRRGGRRLAADIQYPKDVSGYADVGTKKIKLFRDAEASERLRTREIREQRATVCTGIKEIDSPDVVEYAVLKQ